MGRYQKENRAGHLRTNILVKWGDFGVDSRRMEIRSCQPRFQKQSLEIGLRSLWRHTQNCRIFELERFCCQERIQRKGICCLKITPGLVLWSLSGQASSSWRMCLYYHLFIDHVEWHYFPLSHRCPLPHWRTSIFLEYASVCVDR